MSTHEHGNDLFMWFPRHLFKEGNDEIRADVDDEPTDALVSDGHEVGPDVLLGELKEVGVHAGRLQPLHQERHIEAACKEKRNKPEFLHIIYVCMFSRQ